ncbi:MAG: oligosaccharide flippase family protein, partial [Pseudomonadota bacterium]
RLGSNLILTRLLAPEAFGLMALIFAIHSGLQLLTELGVRQAIIRSPNGEDPDFLRTAWTIKVLQFSFVTLLIWILSGVLGLIQAAPFIDLGKTVYAEPQLVPILAVSGLIFLLGGLRPTTIALANRNLKMGRVVLTEFSQIFFAAIATVGFALINPSAWAIVTGVIVGYAVELILCFILFREVPMRFQWDRRYVREIWDFGKWLLGASFLNFIRTRGDRFILGGFLDVATFGIYAVAMIWIDLIVQLLKRVVMRTNFAALSEMGRDSDERLSAGFRKTRLLQDACSFGSAAFVFLVGPPLAVFLYPENFEGVATLLPVLSLILILERYVVFGQLAMRAGDTRGIATLTFIRAVLTLTLIPLGLTFVDWPHALFIVALNGAFGFAFIMRMARKHNAPIRMLVEYAVLTAVVAAYSVYTIWAFGPPTFSAP